MCRLFGFRSVIPSQVHRSLIAADNALSIQSNHHPDGWGVAFYVDGAPHLTRSPSTALGDQIFHRLSGVVASETVLAHVRKATQGSIHVLNCHPFQYGRWTFAHNGDIPNFEARRETVLAAIDPSLRRFILGDTDSEAIFFFLLTRLRARGSLAGDFSAEVVAGTLAAALRELRSMCDTPESSALLTVVVTNGTTMCATMGGKDLFWSTYKRRCGDRDRCPSLSASCEAPTTHGRVNHLVLSSEPIMGENVWQPLARGEIVGVDPDMRLYRSVAEDALAS